MPATVRTVALTVTFGGETLINAPAVSGAICNVIQARGEITADRGWPTCSVFVTARPIHTSGIHAGDAIDEENDLSVVAGAGNNVTRFTGRVRHFRPSGFPKSIEMVATGTLAYAAEWAPNEDLIFDATAGAFVPLSTVTIDTLTLGGTDQTLVAAALDPVPNITYSTANLAGTSIVLGLSAFDAFLWKRGTTAWSYVQALDRATLYRTYQTRDGTIRRVKMIGHPDNTPDFTLANADILDGATSKRNTEQTRNAVSVRGYDYGSDKLGYGFAFGSNSFQGDGSVAATQHLSTFQSSLIENGNDILGDPLPYTLTGLNAQDIADAIIDDVNKEFVEATVPSWRDDTHGPGMTCQLNALDRLAVGEPMWVVRHAWEVGDNGWQATYGLTGGGLPRTNPAPPV